MVGLPIPWRLRDPEAEAASAAVASVGIREVGLCILPNVSFLQNEKIRPSDSKLQTYPS